MQSSRRVRAAEAEAGAAETGTGGPAGRKTGTGGATGREGPEDEGGAPGCIWILHFALIKKMELLVERKVRLLIEKL